MQKTNLKPVLVPTVYSLRTVLWSLALVALFGALLWAYLTFDALLKAKDRLDDHVATTVEMPLYRVGLPLQWETYCKDGDSLTVFRRADKDMPLICFEAQRNDIVTCTQCGGRGYVNYRRQSLFGTINSQETCPSCSGRQMKNRSS